MTTVSPRTPARQFPQDFVFGVATSNYQIEGALHEGGRGTSNWDEFVKEPGRIANGDTAEMAVDFYHRYEEDIDRMAKMGVKAFRMSVGWPRIYPDGTGEPNPEGIAFYQRVVDKLLEKGITPMITLDHWDLPKALADQGGWTNRETVEAFVKFSETMFDALGDKVPLWITHNEPWMASFISYLRGVQAPGHVDDLDGALKAAHHLLLSHGRAVQAYRKRNLPGQIGITLNLLPNYPEHPGDQADVKATRLSDGYTNRWFLDPLYKGHYPADTRKVFEKALGHKLDFIRPGDFKDISAATDFLGVNYYQRRTITAGGEEFGWQVVPAKPDARRTDAGWEVNPEAFTDILLRVKNDYGNPPVYITENGAIFHDEVSKDGKVHNPKRIDFLRDHFNAVLDAMQQGADIRGFTLWSLMDNFEWAMGYKERFGLWYVDYKTQERIPKDSAAYVTKVIQTGTP